MATTAQLRELDNVQWALILTIEDLPYAWTTHIDLLGTGYFADGREVLQGLIPFDYSIAIDATSDFQGKRSIQEIVIEDFDNRLVESLSGFDGTEAELQISVEPADGLFLRTELHDKQVGNERIGPAGERNLYPAFIGFSRPRLHMGLDYELDEVAAAPVSDLPVILEGRRVVLYKVYRDIVDFPDAGGFSTWRPVAEAERRWWGTLRKAGHDVNGKTWSLQCDGVWSLIYKRFGLLSQERPTRVWAPLNLQNSPGNDQTKIGIFLSSIEAAGGAGSIRDYGVGYNDSIIGTDTSGVRLDLSAAMVAAVNLDGVDGKFVDDDLQQCLIDIANGDISVRIDGDLATTRYATVQVRLHLEAWKSMGWDPEVQNSLDDDADLFALFTEVLAGAPGSGYWEGRFTTQTVPGNGELPTYDNDGLPRVWSPIYAGGTMTIRANTEDEPVILNLGEGVVHHSGQFDRAPLSDPDDSDAAFPLGSGVNRHGFWLIEGPRRFAGDEQFDETQIAECSWREPGQDLAQVGGDPPQLVVHRWVNPRRFGVPTSRMNSSWVALQNDAENTVYARPLLRLGYMPTGSSPEQAHVVLQRMLYTTGQTKGWVGFEGGTPAMAATANEPALSPLGIRLDGEHEDLGCAVPKEMIRPTLEWGFFSLRLEEKLRDVSVSLLPGTNTEVLFRALMTPRGWGWALLDGEYGLLDFSQALTPEGAVILDYSNKAVQGRGGQPRLHKSPQQVRAFNPKDKYVLNYDDNPVTGEFRRTTSMRSPDKGSRYRPFPGDRTQARSAQSASTHTVDAFGMRNSAGWRERMSDVAKWYDRGQFWLTDWPVLRRPGQDLWPGTKVVLAEPHAASPDGTYGVVGAVGIVTKLRAKKGGRQYFVDILVDASSVTTLRFNAPVARGRGYDSTTRRIFIDDDHLEIGFEYSDARYFVEPSFSNLGGDAQVQVRQWDGEDWNVTATGEVQDVDTTPGSQSIRIAAPGLTGTYRRDDDALITMRPQPDQTAAWAIALFSPICDDNAMWNTPDEPGFKWA